MRHFRNTITANTPLSLVLGATMLAVMFAAGCGSNAAKSAPAGPADTRATTSTTEAAMPTLTKTTLIARATAICNQNNARLHDAAQQTFGAQQPTDGQWRTFMTTRALPIVAARLDAIRKLGTPSTGAEQLNTILAAGNTAITTAQHNPQLLSPSSRAPFDTFDQLAAAYGIAPCQVGG